MTRQLGVAIFVALLAPASTLPRLVAQGGALGWVALGAVFPLAALVAWRVKTLGEDGLAARLQGRIGALVRTIYYVWAVALCALTTGGCVDRLSQTDYASVPAWALALALAAAGTYLIRRGKGAFFRATEIFYLALLAVLAMLFVLSVVSPHWDRPRLPGAVAWRELGRGALGCASVLSVGTLAAFFPRRPRRQGESPIWAWLAGWCAVTAGLCEVVLGTLGPRLATRLPLPFFVALQGLGIPGGFRRLEALGTAAWVLSDLTLLGLATLAAREIAGGRDWAVAPPLLAALLGGMFLSGPVVEGASPAVLAGNLLLGGALPVVLSLWPRRKGGISCGRKQ